MNERFDPTTVRLQAYLSQAPQAVVAIPVRNEEDRIGACLSALSGQSGCPRGCFGVLLFLNNCTDGTRRTVVEIIPHLPYEVRVIEVDDRRASAGWARRQAMDAASDWLAEDGDETGVILTTDADTRVGPHWIARNLHYIRDGADAVAGRFSLDPDEAALLPASLHARGRREAEYEALLIEIRARIDPDPANPWPCHWVSSGASLAARRSVYERVGGMPDVPLGEDQAFIDLLKTEDMRVRHALDIEVITSGRLDGRAVGGAADTMKLRCEVPESPCDDRLESLGKALLRGIWTRCLRQAHAEGRLRRAWIWSIVLGEKSGKLKLLPRLKTFGGAYVAIASTNRRLAYSPLSPSSLAREIRLARAFVFFLRRLDHR